MEIACILFSPLPWLLVQLMCLNLDQMSSYSRIMYGQNKEKQNLEPNNCKSTYNSNLKTFVRSYQQKRQKRIDKEWECTSLSVWVHVTTLQSKIHRADKKEQDKSKL